MQRRMVSIEGVKNKIDKSRSSVYDMLNPRSKYFCADFPKPIRIGKRSVRWFEDELDQYLASCPRVVSESVEQEDAQ